MRTKNSLGSDKREEKNRRCRAIRVMSGKTERKRRAEDKEEFKQE